MSNMEVEEETITVAEAFYRSALAHGYKPKQRRFPNNKKITCYKCHRTIETITVDTETGHCPNCGVVLFKWKEEG